MATCLYYSQTRQVFQLCTDTAADTMHSPITNRQTHLYCFDNDLEAEVNSCPSPSVDIDPLSSPAPPSNSADLNSTLIDFVIKNFSADEIGPTDLITSESEELPSDLETAIRRLSTTVLVDKTIFVYIQLHLLLLTTGIGEHRSASATGSNQQKLQSQFA